MIAMSDGVLAAIIAAGATVFGSFVQLRASVGKEIAARTRSAPTRKANHAVVTLLLVMLLGAAVGGFALAQWAYENELGAQQALVRDLRDRIGDLALYKHDIEQSRAALSSVVKTDVLRQMGADGVVVLATAPPCKPPALASGATTSTPGGPLVLPAGAAKPSGTVSAQSRPSAPVGTCAESDATPIVLCATIPAAAQLGSVDLYVRQTDAAGRWSDSRLMPGEANAQAKFPAKPMEIEDGSALKQVCTGFTQWSDQPRTARMVVHYSF